MDSKIIFNSFIGFFIAIAVYVAVLSIFAYFLLKEYERDKDEEV